MKKGTFPEHTQKIILDNVTVVVDAKEDLMSCGLQARGMPAVAHKDDLLQKDKSTKSNCFKMRILTLPLKVQIVGEIYYLAFSPRVGSHLVITSKSKHTF